mgnify:CR=1 FL=1
MKIINSVFEKSSKTVNQCPNNNLPEFALVGRSNVGKSSLINSLLNNKSIAKISSKPGKTLLINHFRINDKLYIVDLPGYGYASISKKIKEDIKTIHKSYFKSRKELLYTLLLIDIRHDIQENDIEFMEFLSSNYCPFIIIFTKSDKLKIETVVYFFNSSVKSPPFKYKIPFLILCSCFLLIFPLVQRTNVSI